MTPTENERFSQLSTTACKPLKFPSVFRPPGSLPFVEFHFFCIMACLNISDSGTNCAAVCINLRYQNNCYSDSKHVSCQVSSEHFANHQNDINVSKFQILMF